MVERQYVPTSAFVGLPAFVMAVLGLDIQKQRVLDVEGTVLQMFLGLRGSEDKERV